MTSFDFVTTIAMGSLVASASQSKEWTAFLQSLAAMAALFVAQFVAAKLRQKSKIASHAMQNEPVLLVRDGKVLERALSETRVNREDLFAKLREANVSSLDSVRAVVLETTGDVSVMHGADIAEAMLHDVERAGEKK